MWSIFRVLLGLLAAFLVAGVVQALFIITPGDLAGTSSDALIGRFTGLATLALLAASQAAAFAGLPALVAVVLAERWSLRSVVLYALLGLVLAGVGFLAQAGVAVTAIEAYALTAYAVMGLVGGCVYWLISGRLAGGGAR